jgi:hypothetical protein
MQQRCSCADGSRRAFATAMAGTKAADLHRRDAQRPARRFGRLIVASIPSLT